MCHIAFHTDPEGLLVTVVARKIVDTFLDPLEEAFGLCLAERREVSSFLEILDFEEEHPVFEEFLDLEEEHPVFE